MASKFTLDFGLFPFLLIWWYIFLAICRSPVGFSESSDGWISLKINSSGLLCFLTTQQNDGAFNCWDAFGCFIFLIMLSWKVKNWFIQYTQWKVFHFAHFFSTLSIHSNDNYYCAEWIGAEKDFFGTLAQLPCTWSRWQYP
jgi:hypothetical protein